MVNLTSLTYNPRGNSPHTQCTGGWVGPTAGLNIIYKVHRNTHKRTHAHTDTQTHTHRHKHKDTHTNTTNTNIQTHTHTHTTYIFEMQNTELQRKIRTLEDTVNQSTNVKVRVI
jgi:hypothetical protein